MVVEMDTLILKIQISVHNTTTLQKYGGCRPAPTGGAVLAEPFNISNTPCRRLEGVKDL